MLTEINETGLFVPKITLGALHFGVYLSEKQSLELISEAFDCGINSIDTAPLYGNGLSERFVGNAVSKKRDAFIISSKAGLKKQYLDDGRFGVDVERLNSKNIRQSIENSLRALNTDYIDIFYLHAFDEKNGISEALETLGKLRGEGKIRVAAVSNFSPEQVNCCSDIISIAQVHYNLIERKAEIDFIDSCRKKNIKIFCNRPLARGILTDKYCKSFDLPKNSRANLSKRISEDLSSVNRASLRKLNDFAVQRGISLVEASLEWLINQKEVISLVLGVRNRSQLDLISKWYNHGIPSELVDEINDLVLDNFATSKLMSKPEYFFEK